MQVYIPTKEGTSGDMAGSVTEQTTVCHDEPRFRYKVLSAVNVCCVCMSARVSYDVVLRLCIRVSIRKVQMYGGMYGVGMSAYTKRKSACIGRRGAVVTKN